MARTALIVGAGIGGLAAGIALRRTGWNVRIYEQSAALRELGFGLGLAANAIAALRALGVADTVIERSFRPRRGELRRMDGKVLKFAEVPAAASPLIVALRPALHGALLDAVGPESISVNSEAVGFTIAGDRVTLELDDGARIDADLLIGADGVGSTIRRIVHPAERPPRRSGIVAVRGAVHGAIGHLAGLDAVYYFGRGVESMFVRASETGMYWFLSLAESLVPASMRDPKAIVDLMSPRFDDTFRKITAATYDLRCDDLVDRDPIRSWGTGRVTLLGDAAHAMLPHTGQGASQALVDAVSLARALEGDRDLPRALRAYENARIGKTAALVRQGRRTARIMATMDPIACGIRDNILRMMPITQFVNFYMRINRRAGTT
jgi:2-polyprenyl-6-methoxyphenol hydroxylase-like FAD-dependent oxidoreductase